MKMNKLLAVLLTALFLAPFFAARAETAPAFTVDEGAVLKGMDRSWRQGYTPSAAGDKWTMILPVRSGEAAGRGLRSAQAGAGIIREELPDNLLESACLGFIFSAFAMMFLLRLFAPRRTVHLTFCI